MKRRMVTAEEVKKHREETGAGMMEAKRHIQTEYDREYVLWLKSASTEEKIDFLLDKELDRLTK